MSDPSSTSLDPETGFTGDPISTSKIAQAANDLRMAAGEKARAIAHSAQHLRETASERAHQFRETATEQWNDTRIRAKEIHVSAEDYVRQNPTKSVLIALGAGFLIGLVVRR